jgi:hypothetical protein
VLHPSFSFFESFCSSPSIHPSAFRPRPTPDAIGKTPYREVVHRRLTRELSPRVTSFFPSDTRPCLRLIVSSAVCSLVDLEKLRETEKKRKKKKRDYLKRATMQKVMASGVRRSNLMNVDERKGSKPRVAPLDFVFRILFLFPLDPPECVPSMVGTGCRREETQ